VSGREAGAKLADDADDRGRAGVVGRLGGARRLAPACKQLAHAGLVSHAPDDQLPVPLLEVPLMKLTVRLTLGLVPHMTQHDVAVDADDVEHLLDDHRRVDGMIERVSGVSDIESIAPEVLDQVLAVETPGRHRRHDVRLGEQPRVAVGQRIDSRRGSNTLRL
jgi:hypothetical protein